MNELIQWLFYDGASISTLYNIIALVLGLVGLYFGADFLIRGGVKVALAAGVKKVVVGLTVVAFGTSLPELVVSVTSTLTGDYSIAIGNVVGSNIANIALVLGIAAIIRPVDVENVVLKFDMWVVLGVSILFMILSIDGVINVFDGVVLIFSFIAYIIWVSYTSKEHHLEEEIDNGEKKSSIILNLLLIILGLCILVIGSKLTVVGGTSIARDLGVSELIIGLTIIAVGTSLPELATTIVAQVRKESDITVGNLIGSNIFNILFVIGVAAVVTPFVITDPVNNGLVVEKDAVNIFMPIMIAIAIILLPILATHKKVTRKEGFFLLFCYIIYIIYIVVSGNSNIIS